MVAVLVAVLAALLATFCWLHHQAEAELRLQGGVLPGPRPWPVIGSLHLMANFKRYPFEVFTRLQEVGSPPWLGVVCPWWDELPCQWGESSV